MFMTIVHVLILAFGLYTVVRGADLLVKQASLLACWLRVNPFFVGVILLGMGTSAPEWAVSAISSIKDMPNLALANVFGSNIFNILLVLALIMLKPLSTSHIYLMKKDVLFLFFSGFLLIPIMMDGVLSRYDALILTLVFCLYIALSLWSAQKEKKSTSPTEVSSGGEKSLTEEDTSLKGGSSPSLTEEDTSLKGGSSPSLHFNLKATLLLVLGFVLLIGGSHLTVMGAEGVGRAWGMSERFIGILIVSVGTSLPELFASLSAILKGRQDMAIGNIVGSNIFNTFAIAGTSAWIQPISLDSKMWTMDLPTLLLIHIALLSILFCYKWKWFQRALPYAFFSGYIVYLVLLLI